MYVLSFFIVKHKFNYFDKHIYIYLTLLLLIITI